MCNRRISLILNDLRMGGSERQSLLLAPYLIGQGWSVTVASLAGPGPLQQSFAELGAECRTMHLRYPWSLYYFPFYLFRLIIFLRSLRPDVILPYTSMPNVYCSLIWKWTSARLCIWNQRSAGVGRLHSFLEKIAVQKASGFIANSASGRDFLERELGVPLEKVNVIHNGVLMPDSHVPRGQWRTKLKLSCNDIIACMIGNFRAPKDHATLIQAWARVVKQYDSSKGRPVLLLVGRNDETEEVFKRQVTRLKLDNFVHFLGYQPDVFSVLQDTDLGVFSSLNEGLPNGVLECMAAGLPLVATELPGVRECLPREQFSYLAQPGNADEFAQKILRLITDTMERKRLGELNRNRVATQFSVDSMARTTLKVIEQELTLLC
jgi:glycosyltransferase involved in cell wall biosynthesis